MTEMWNGNRNSNLCDVAASAAVCPTNARERCQKFTKTGEKARFLRQAGSINVVISERVTESTVCVVFVLLIPSFASTHTMVSNPHRFVIALVCHHSFSSTPGRNFLPRSQSPCFGAQLHARCCILLFVPMASRADVV